MDGAGAGAGTSLAGLTDTRSASAEYSLSDASIRGPAGRVIRIVSGAVQGAMDQSILRDQTVRVSGWAADSRSGAPVDRIFAFTDGGLLYEDRPSLARPDIGAQKHRSPEGFGFAFEVPTPTAQRAGNGLQVFGVRGDVASRLSWYCAAGARQDVGCG